MPSKEERYAHRATQLEQFCAKYDLNPKDATIAGGFRKDVLIFPNEVYILPYSDESDIFATREHAFFRVYHGRLGVEIPRLLRSFRDEEFCPYIIGVLSRLHGDALPVMESMNFQQTAEVFFSLAESAAGWHNVPPDPELFAIHGKGFANISPLPLMNRWLSWLLTHDPAEPLLDWFLALVQEHAQKESLDTSFLTHPSTKRAWLRVFNQLAALEHVVLHADMHDGQFLLAPGTTKVSAVIDWDNFCLGNPLIDFNTCKWFADKMWTFREHFHEMRTEMWQRHLAHRKISGCWKGGLNLFLVMTETVRTIGEKDRPKIWMTKGTYKPALEEYLHHLEQASAGIPAE